MILTYKNKPEIVCLRGYLRNFCRNFGKKRNFGRNLDFTEFRPKFRIEREFRPNRNRNQKSSFRFRSNRNRNTNLNFGFGFLLSKIRFLCSLGSRSPNGCSDRSSGEGDNGENLIDHYHQFKLKTVLSRQACDRWSSKFFLLVKMLRAAYMLASLKLCRATHMEVRREALGILLRSLQLHYPMGVNELAETEIHQIKVTNLRLDSQTARSLYGTKYIPVLGKEDPIKFKAMSRAHMAGPQVLRTLHHL